MPDPLRDPSRWPQPVFTSPLPLQFPVEPTEVRSAAAAAELGPDPGTLSLAAPAAASASGRARAAELRAKWATYLSDAWGVHAADLVVDRYGIGLVAKVARELTTRQQLGSLPSLANPGGYFASVLRGQAAEIARLKAAEAADRPPETSTPITPAQPQDPRLDPYRPMLRYVKSIDQQADANDGEG